MTPEQESMTKSVKALAVKSTRDDIVVASEFYKRYYNLDLDKVDPQTARTLAISFLHGASAAINTILASELTEAQEARERFKRDELY